MDVNSRWKAKLLSPHENGAHWLSTEMFIHSEQAFRTFNVQVVLRLRTCRPPQACKRPTARGIVRISQLKNFVALASGTRSSHVKSCGSETSKIHSVFKMPALETDGLRVVRNVCVDGVSIVISLAQSGWSYGTAQDSNPKRYDA